MVALLQELKILLLQITTLLRLWVEYDEPVLQDIFKFCALNHLF